MAVPFLIFAIGNESRGDDALGPLLLRELALWLNVNNLSEQFELIEDFQLQIEHSMDMRDRRRVLFIDAGMDTPAPFSCYPVKASDAPVLYSHALSPEALLKVYAQFYGDVAPDAFVLCIRGYSFELGEPPSPEAMKNLVSSFSFCKALMSDPDALTREIRAT